MRVAKAPTRTSHMRLRTYYRLVWEDEANRYLPPDAFSDVDEEDDDTSLPSSPRFHSHFNSVFNHNFR